MLSRHCPDYSPSLLLSAHSNFICSIPPPPHCISSRLSSLSFPPLPFPPFTSLPPRVAMDLSSRDQTSIRPPSKHCFTCVSECVNVVCLRVCTCAFYLNECVFMQPIVQYLDCQEFSRYLMIQHTSIILPPGLITNSSFLFRSIH
jgi:hypothetical protein